MAAPRRLLITLRGVVEAPVDRVAPLALDLPAVEGVSAGVDEAGRMAWQQGGWWYRGETSVAPHEKGTLVTYQIFDVAATMRWGVRFVSAKPLRAAPAVFQAGLTRLGEQLGCAAHPVGDAPPG